MSLVARFQGFGYAYPDQDAPALRDLDLELGQGLTVLEGPSGGGKSTLLRALDGLVPHFHGGSATGLAEVLREDLRQARPRRLARQVAMVFQEPESQFVMETVAREVAFGPENLGLPRSEIRCRVDRSLQQMGISELAERKVSQISGGQRQRLALASALAMRPRLLVLDEPTSQLDDEGADRLRRACAELVQEGASVVVAEHRPWRVGPAAAGRLRLEEGSLVAGERFPDPPPPQTRRRSGMGAVALRLEGVSAGPGFEVVGEVALELREGELACLTGDNGSGKTTLLRTAAGLLPPRAGSVWRREGRCAYLPQEAGAVLHQPTVRREVEQTARWLGLALDPTALLEELDLAQLADRDPRDLSAGQRQRAALAAVLVGGPELVFLDEPTRGIDRRSGLLLRSLLERLTAAGAAVLVATSDARLAFELGDHVHTVARGRLRPALGPPT